MAIEPGRVLLHYLLIEKIGEGGMGVVWKARDRRLRRDVALKLLPPQIAEVEERRHRFLREARAAAAISHPHIATVYEVGEAEGHTFIAMELVRGTTLRLEGKPLPVPEALSIASQIADGLTHAHEAGVVHRDLKPDNVMIGQDGHVRILDFGLARLSDSEDMSPLALSRLSTISDEMTREGKVFGTAAYMSPEQARGMRVDARSDMFSFGATLYEMVTGRLPFHGATPLDTLTAVLQADPMPASALNADVPLELDRIIRKCLQKNPDDRYQDTRDMLLDLRQLKRDTDSQPLQRPASGAYRAPSSMSPGVRVVLGIALLAMVVVAAFLGSRSLVNDRRTAGKIQQRLLTTNSVENPVWNAEISPDGRYLAYTEDAGSFVKVLETGEIKKLTPDVGTKSFDLAGWFPDGSRLLLSAYPAGEDPSLWTLSIVTGAVRKLRDHASALYIAGCQVSPDGQTIAFTPARAGRQGLEGELWLMDADGTNPRKLLAPDDEDQSVTWWVRWSPDAQRLLYRRQAKYPDGVKNSIETCDLEGGSRTVVLPPLVHLYPGIHATWLVDGRVIVARTDSKDRPRDGNLWAIDVDVRSGEPRGEPVRLTNWVDWVFYGLTSSDAGELAIVRYRNQDEVYLTSLDAGAAGLVVPQRLTMDSRNDQAVSWMEEGRALLLYSDRRGTGDVFRLDVESKTIDPIVASPAEEQPVTLTPDGRWLLYLVGADPPGSGSLAPRTLMRISVDGGSPEKLGTLLRGESVQCGTNVDSRCVLTEASREHILVFEFDPRRGKGHQLVELESSSRSVRLAPDGDRLAWHVPGDGGPVRLVVLDLATQERHEIPIADHSTLGQLSWSVEGDCLYAPTGSDEDPAVLRIDLDGTWTEIPANDLLPSVHLLPAPGGSQFVFSKTLRESAIWLVAGL